MSILGNLLESFVWKIKSLDSKIGTFSTRIGKILDCSIYNSQKGNIK